MSSYSCSNCNKTNVKLWRKSHDLPVLKCAECLGAAKLVDSTGKVFSDTLLCRTDQIGSYVPAVPVNDRPEVFWSYTAVPIGDVEWWTNLPSN